MLEITPNTMTAIGAAGDFVVDEICGVMTATEFRI